MAPTCTTLSPQQLPLLSKKEQAALAETLAQGLNRYIKLQVTYSAFLRTDPTKLQEMFASMKQSQSPEVLQNIDPYHFEDPHAIIAQYDRALEQLPKNYEEYFLHMNYAFSAAVLFNEHKVYPILMGNRGIRHIFDRRLAQLQVDLARELDPSRVQVSSKDCSEDTANDELSPSTSASIPVTQKITEPEAHALLGDYATLMKHNFVSSAGSEDALRWKVNSVALKADMRAQYGLTVEDSEGALEMDEADMVSFMMDSQIQAA